MFRLSKKQRGQLIKDLSVLSHEAFVTDAVNGYLDRKVTWHDIVPLIGDDDITEKSVKKHKAFWRNFDRDAAVENASRMLGVLGDEYVVCHGVTDDGESKYVHISRHEVYHRTKHAKKVSIDLTFSAVVSEFGGYVAYESAMRALSVIGGTHRVDTSVGPVDITAALNQDNACVIDVIFSTEEDGIIFKNSEVLA